MSQTTVLKIVDNIHVDLNGVKLSSTGEVAEALKALHADSPDVCISVEADKPDCYEAIGKAIYASHRAGFGERLRVFVDGKQVND